MHWNNIYKYGKEDRIVGGEALRNYDQLGVKHCLLLFAKIMQFRALWTHISNHKKPVRHWCHPQCLLQLWYHRLDQPHSTVQLRNMHSCISHFFDKKSGPRMLTPTGSLKSRWLLRSRQEAINHSMVLIYWLLHLFLPLAGYSNQNMQGITHEIPKEKTLA